MWSRFKGQVLRGKDEKDLNNDDTIVTRALLKYYDPEIPTWLLAPGSEMRDRVTAATRSAYSQTPQPPAPVSAPEEPAPRQFVRHESGQRMFDRPDQPLTNQSPQIARTQSTASSGLASRLKNTRW